MTSSELMQKLESLASHDPKDLAGMARFGINVDKAWVISIPKLRNLAAEVKKSTIPKERHQLALEIWETRVHEAKILAGLIDVPELVTEEQMEKWVLDFDSWDVVDMVVGNLFDRTKFAVPKAHEWAGRKEEFVKRAGFVIMATLAVHDKKLENSVFEDFLGIIARESSDSRNFVKKAINWALRSIGKSRNKYLYQKSIETANNILDKFKDNNSEPGRAARFVANGALSELGKKYITDRF